MDILKVLSRGTKKTARNATSKQNATRPLPSAGAQPNPQLYHDEARGTKRKRTGQEDRDAPTAELPVVDFFGSTPAETSSSKPAERAPAQRARSPPPPAPAVKLSGEQCRQLLRSHRLKITLLSKPREKTKVKKSKKKHNDIPEENKGERKHLFPQPMESFADLPTTYGVSPTVVDNLVRQGYRLPTEVQMGSLPLLLRPDLALADGEDVKNGIDFLAVAPTGSGKTISFLIPAINSIMKRRAREELHGIREVEAVILAPTRELVHQIVNEGTKLMQGTGLKIVAMKKTTQLAAEQQQPQPQQQQQHVAEDSSDEDEEGESDDDSVIASEQGKGPRMKRGTKNKPHPETKTDILVTTPTLLLNFLNSGPAGTRKVLPTVRHLVLDEADVLLDPLFREQTLELWCACTSNELRLSFWSATMGSNIESLVTEQLEARARTAATEARPLVRLVVGLKDTAVPNIVHKLTYTASEQGKLLALRQLLHPAGSDDSGPPLRPPFLVFTQTIDRAAALHEELKYDIPLEAGGPSRIAALHSALADSARSAVMRRFRAGEIWVLITTDVLARGVDFAGVNGVVNFDVPGSAAAYVHRAGRTGRAGRLGGVAVTFYTKDDIPFVKTVANVIAASEKQAGRTGDEASVQKWLLDALPKVAKADRKMLREKGVASRRSGGGGGGGKAKITSKSGYERTKEHNRKGAMDANKRRRMRGGHGDGGGDDEWAGLGD